MSDNLQPPQLEAATGPVIMPDGKILTPAEAEALHLKKLEAMKAAQIAELRQEGYELALPTAPPPPPGPSPVAAEPATKPAVVPLAPSKKRRFFIDDPDFIAGSHTIDGETFEFVDVPEDVKEWLKKWDVYVAGTLQIPLELFRNGQAFKDDPTLQLKFAPLLAEKWNVVVCRCVSKWTLPAEISTERKLKLDPVTKRDLHDRILATTQLGLGNQEYLRLSAAENKPG